MSYRIKLDDVIVEAMHRPDPWYTEAGVEAAIRGSYTVDDYDYVVLEDAEDIDGLISAMELLRTVQRDEIGDALAQLRPN
ncbi:MAG TPA: hypothetical protein VGG55_02495 [Candidatus Acidoferrales bacterium]